MRGDHGNGFEPPKTPAFAAQGHAVGPESVVEVPLAGLSFIVHWPRHEAYMKRYFIRRGSQERGPYPAGAIRKLAADGRILRSDELRAEGTDRYVRASSIRSLFVTPPTTITGAPSSSSPPPLPATKTNSAAAPPLQSPKSPVPAVDDPRFSQTAQVEDGSHSGSTSRPRHVFLRILGYTLIVVAGLTWFVVEPLSRSPPKGEGFVKIARGLKGDNENTPVKMLSLCIAIAGVVCLVKSSGRGLTDVSTPEQLGLAHDSARDQLFTVAYSSGRKHEDAILGLLLIRPNDVLFRPDRLNPLQNRQIGGINFVMSMLGAKTFAINDGQDWLTPSSSIQRVVRSGWIVRSVHVVTAQEVHGRTDHYFYGTGRNAFSRQAQNRLIECLAGVTQQHRR